HTSRDDFDFSTVIASGAPGDTAPPGNLVTIDFLPRAVRYLRIQMTSLSGSWWSIHELGAACQIPGPNGTWTTDKPSSEGLCGPGQPPGADAGASDASADGASDGGAAEAGNSDGGSDGDGGEIGEIGSSDGGPADPFDRTHWTVSASSTSANAGDVLANAIDGNIATRWSSGRAQTGDEFFKVDLGSVGCVSQIRIVSSGTDFAAAYSVNVSTDDQTYVRVAKGIGTNLLQIGFSPRRARFIRINQLGTSSSWWSIDELLVLP
ncbi:MAG TPA: discoidin domain-containing protein, partial [Polyangia bacterium]|nr:discoidin domain-containing protein [Polyangia bacterium]